jgi:hypothetical protein
MFRVAFSVFCSRAAPPASTRALTRSPLALGLALGLAGSGLWTPLAHADEVSNLATRLAELRSEVESLSDQLAAHKNDQQEQVRSFGRQKSELELEIQREHTRVEKLRQAISQKRTATNQQKAENQSLGPAFEKQLASVRGYVQGTLPFRIKERLSELDKIEEQFKSGLLPPQRALNRLWGFVEDELRMTRESGLFSQPVEVAGKEQLADVIRVGMVTMYYRTPEGDVGHSVNGGDAWTFQPIQDEAGQKQVRELFETFKKQIRVGYFELPNALPTVKR